MTDRWMNELRCDFMATVMCWSMTNFCLIEMCVVLYLGYILFCKIISVFGHSMWVIISSNYFVCVLVSVFIDTFIGFDFYGVIEEQLIQCQLGTELIKK